MKVNLNQDTIINILVMEQLLSKLEQEGRTFPDAGQEMTISQLVEVNGEYKISLQVILNMAMLLQFTTVKDLDYQEANQLMTAYVTILAIINVIGLAEEFESSIIQYKEQL